MTVPPYGSQPDQPQTPGYGYQPPYDGGRNPYGSPQQQPQYGSQPPYGQSPYGQEPTSAYGQAGGGGQPPYGNEPPPAYGGPLPPPPPRRNLGLIAGVIVGATVLVLGAALLITLNLRGDDDTELADTGTSESATGEEEPTTDAATTETEDTGSEVGQCLPYEPEISGDGLALVDCSDATAFWEITAQSYDVTDVEVDADGNLVDTARAKELCGEDWSVNYLGELWTNWHYVYSSGTLDSLYCIQATGTPDPNEPDHMPITPDTGDCFDDSDDWWSVDCSSDIALYKVVDTVVYDDPVEMSSDEAAEAATCGGEWYWQITTPEGLTSAIICADEV